MLDSKLSFPHRMISILCNTATVLTGRCTSRHRCVLFGGCAWWYVPGISRISPATAPIRTKQKVFSNHSVHQSPSSRRPASLVLSCSLNRQRCVRYRVRRKFAAFFRRPTNLRPARIGGAPANFSGVSSTETQFGVHLLYRAVKSGICTPH